MKLKRIISALLLLAMLCSCLPFTAMAVEGENDFYFSAETSEALLVSPRKIPYSDGQTISEALADAGISLTFDSGSGFVSAIQGVESEYTYASVPAERSLADSAADVSYFAFYGADGDGEIGAGRQVLMRALADCAGEEADVRAVVQGYYTGALAAYCGISDTDAEVCAAELTKAIQDYKNSLTGTTCAVTVSASEADCIITAENEYGRVFSAESGVLQLPVGQKYTITARKDNREASVTREITAATEVAGLTLPTGSWFNEAAFALSATNDNDAAFQDGLADTRLDAHTVTAAIPDAFSGKLYAYVLRSADAPKDAALRVRYTGASGEQYDKPFTEDSKITSIPDVLQSGTDGNTVVFSLDRAEDGGCTQRMTLTLRLDRLPTLSALTVTAASTDGKKQIVQAAAEGAFSSLQNSYTYQILNTLTSVNICPTASMTGYTIRVNDASVTSGQSISVPLNGTTTATVTVSGGGYENRYTLTLRPGAGQRATFNTAGDVTLRVTNAAGEVLDYDSERNSTTGGKSYFYTLVSGKTYTYVATKDTYYHATASFKLESAASFSNIDVPTDAQLQTIALGASAVYGNPQAYSMTPAFAPAVHQYTVTVPDDEYTVAAWATFASGNCGVRYTPMALDGNSKLQTTPLNSGDDLGVSLRQAVLSGNALGNELTFRLSRTVDSVEYYTDYFVTLRRSFSLNSLKASCGGSELELQGDGTKKYDPSVTEYTLWVPSAATSLDLQCGVHAENLAYGQREHGYIVTVGGETVPASGAISVPLNGTETDDIIEVQVGNRLAPETEPTTITLTVHKQQSTAIRIQAEPAGALVFLRERSSNQPLQKRLDGSFALSKGFVYDYSVTKNGSIGQGGAMRVTDDGKTVELGTVSDKGVFTVLRSQSCAEIITFTLSAAPINGSLQTELSAEWADFRGTQYTAGQPGTAAYSNNGVTAAKTPIHADEGTLYWAVQIGNGYGKDAVGCPILAGDALITYSGNHIYRIDPDTGKTLTEGTMVSNSSYSIVPPTYSDGMVFVGLKDGQIQAFDAVSLKSLWVYTDPLGGQPNSPITVRDGYLYTGFWNGETKKANYVCLSITDEDPTQETEEKLATWTYAQKGGFYWAGAYAGDGFLLLGTDDGYSGYDHTTGQILLLDAKTGEKLDGRSGFRGDVRSSVCYDRATDAYYATSKGGDFIRIKLSSDKRSIAESKTLVLQNGNDKSIAMSTSTPVVYKGRAYVGVSGSSQFKMYTGHNITVIDLAGEMSIAYRVETQGYPQTSGLLTTGYEGVNEYIYVYFFDNYTPGKLRVLRDHAGQTAADLLTEEISPEDGTQHETAYTLFTPTGKQAQYAICSPIVDKNGTIYFKNDTGCLMAYGSMLDHYEQTGAAVTEYHDGDAFDLGTLRVTAVYQNGTKRDVTARLLPSDQTVTEGMKAITLRLDVPDDLYHDRTETDRSSTAGVETRFPTIEIPITVLGREETGTIDDLSWSYVETSGKLMISGSFDGRTLIAACYDANGRMIQVQTLDKADDLTLEPSSTRIRLFLLDKDSKPVCRTVTVKGTK